MFVEIIDDKASFEIVKSSALLIIDECLNMNWFMSPEDAREKIERWRRDYNEFRPHSATSYLTPAEFALKIGAEAVYTMIFLFNVDYSWGDTSIYRIFSVS